MIKVDHDLGFRRPSLPTIVLITLGLVILRLRFSDVYTQLSPLVPSGLRSWSDEVTQYKAHIPAADAAGEELTNKTMDESHPVVKCIVYDRPMRTASTTITGALIKCFSGLKWSIDRHHLGNNRSRCVELEFERKRPPYAMVKGHKWLTSYGVQILRTRCTHLVYITSTAPLWEQVWSAAKMLSNVRTNGNSTLDSAKREAALAWVKANGANYARMYEYYPHIRLTQPLELQPDRRYPDLPPSFERDEILPEIVPDYVIRKSHVTEDLPVLLKAFGCETDSNDAKNVHSIVSDDGNVEDDEAYKDMVRKLANISDGETYLKLMSHAKLNNRGLDHIREVMNA